MDTIEIKRDEYDKLKADAARVADLDKKVAPLEEAAEKLPTLEKQLEDTETAKVAAEKERDDAKEKLEAAEEKARAQDLAKERLGKLGKGFTGKLGDFTRSRLEEHAGSLKDEEWDARLKELEELAGVKRDDGADASEDEDDDTFTRDETARSKLGGGSNGGNGSEPSATARRSVVAGLVKAGK